MPSARDILGLSLLGTAAALGLVAAKYKGVPFEEVFQRVAKDQGIDAALLKAIAKQESNFTPDVMRREPDGAVFHGSAQLYAQPGVLFSIGIMQVTNDTAKRLGIDPVKLFDPQACITAAAKLLVALRRELGSSFTLETWVASYNAGSPHVLRFGITNTQYVANVLLNYRLYTIGANA